MYNQTIINIFKELQLYWEIKGDTHRSNAYRNAINVLESYHKPILKSYDIPDLPGIGKRSIDKMKLIIDKGYTLKDFIPEEDLQLIKAYSSLIKIKDVGKIQAIKWIKEYDILSLKDLKKKVKNKEITLTDGQKIGLKYYKDLNTPIPRQEIIKLEKIVNKTVRQLNNDLEVYILGSYRRNKPFSRDLDVLLVNPRIVNITQLSQAVSIIKSFIIKLSENGISQLPVKIGSLNEVTKKKNLKSINIEYLWKSKFSKGYWRKVDLKFFAYESKITSIMYFTGSRNFNRTIRERLKNIGYLLNQYGLFKKKLKTYKSEKKGGVKYVRIHIKYENDIFRLAKMKYISPQKRM